VPTRAPIRHAKVAPFAVNQIVHASNDRLEHDVELCVKHRVPIVITSLRPPAEVVSAVHGYGGIVFHDVINLRHAQKAAGQGVDGIIAVCAGAGGHAGVLSPFALVKEIRAVYDGTIILSGAMSTGADVLAARALGADLAYLGTRFIATDEANASAGLQAMLVDSKAEDIVYTSLFSGIAGNYLRAASSQTGLDPDKLPEARQIQDEFRQRRQHRTQGVEGYLERRPKRERHRRDRVGRGAGFAHGKRIPGGARVRNR
jgi:nitronate monooxygenase